MAPTWKRTAGKRIKLALFCDWQSENVIWKPGHSRRSIRWLINLQLYNEYRHYFKMQIIFGKKYSSLFLSLMFSSQNALYSLYIIIYPSITQFYFHHTKRPTLLFSNEECYSVFKDLYLRIDISVAICWDFLFPNITT